MHIPGLKAGTQPFQFVVALAKAAGGLVGKAHLKTVLSDARRDDTVAARHAKLDAKKFIAQAMAGAGRELKDDPFPSKDGCYRCTLISHIV